MKRIKDAIILRLYFIFLYLKTRAYFIKIRYQTPKVRNSKDTVKLLNNKKISIARFGDGEFDVIDGNGRRFQQYDENLANRLGEVLDSCDDRIAVGIPNIFRFRPLMSLKVESRIFWLNYLRKSYSIAHIKRNKVYYDSLFTRFYITYRTPQNAKRMIPELKRLWEGAQIVIVEGENNRLGVGNDFFSNTKSIERIICPRRNAYSIYERILETIKRQSREKLILISLGHTATILAYDLACSGYWAIDIGQIDFEYDLYNKKASKKRGHGKNLKVLTEELEAVYNSQIINKLL